MIRVYCSTSAHGFELMSLREFSKKIPRSAHHSTVYSYGSANYHVNSIPSPIFFVDPPPPDIRNLASIATSSIGGSSSVFIQDGAGNIGWTTTGSNITLSGNAYFTGNQTKLCPTPFFDFKKTFCSLLEWEGMVEYQGFPPGLSLVEYLNKLAPSLNFQPTYATLNGLPDPYCLVRVKPRTYALVFGRDFHFIQYKSQKDLYVSLTRSNSLFPVIKFPKNDIKIRDIFLGKVPFITKSTGVAVFDKMLNSHPNPKKNIGVVRIDHMFPITHDFKDFCEELVGKSSSVIVKNIANKMVMERPVWGLFKENLLNIFSRNLTYEDLSELEKIAEIDYILMAKCILIKKYLKNVDRINTVLSSHKDIFKENSQGVISTTANMVTGNYPDSDLNIAGLQELQEGSATYVNYDDFFNQLSESQIVKILTDKDFWTVNFRDIARQINEFDLKIPDKWSNVQYLHDKISAMARIAQAKRDAIKFEYTENQKILDGYEWSDKDQIVFTYGPPKPPKDLIYRLELPKDSADMLAYGTNHHNCVGTYKDKVRNKQSLIVAIYLNGKHEWTAELGESINYASPKPAEPVVGTWIGKDSLPSVHEPSKQEFNKTLNFRQIRGNCNQDAPEYHKQNIMRAINYFHEQVRDFDLITDNGTFTFGQNINAAQVAIIGGGGGGVGGNLGLAGGNGGAGHMGTLQLNVAHQNNNHGQVGAGYYQEVGNNQIILNNDAIDAQRYAMAGHLVEPNPRERARMQTVIQNIGHE